MTIRNRIFLAMLVLAVGMVAVGGLGLYGMNGIVGDLEDMYRRRVVGTRRYSTVRLECVAEGLRYRHGGRSIATPPPLWRAKP